MRDKDKQEQEQQEAIQTAIRRLLKVLPPGRVLVEFGVGHGGALQPTGNMVTSTGGVSAESLTRLVMGLVGIDLGRRLVENIQRAFETEEEPSASTGLPN